jgi:trans-L-3-hydroxyproline dehydratase
VIQIVMAKPPSNVLVQSMIGCIEMHTTGEPTRIVTTGYPVLNGTLLQQRAEAKAKYDHIRRRLNWEPRGHFDMYGAILRPDTELTASGQAHIGVLFTTNEGYSTMCGHATIALGRMLVDADEELFPRRLQLRTDSENHTTVVNLHAPCGLIEVTVPTSSDGTRSDPSRPVSFVSVPSFATGVSVRIPVNSRHTWPELEGRDHVTADFSYGGAFYCLISVEQLGFSGRLNQLDLVAVNIATKNLKAAVKANPELSKMFDHPVEKDLSFLYSVMVVDDHLGDPAPGSTGAETGLCYFADQSIDRSPTGSAVAARVALAHAKDTNFTQTRTYHSLVSQAAGVGNTRGAFNGRVVENLPSDHPFPVVRVRVEGYAFYTGFTQYVVEEADPLGDDGFIFDKLSVPVQM